MSLAVDVLIGNPNVVNFAANSNVQQQLQNNYAMEFLQMRVTGLVTLAGFTTNPAKYLESLENLIAQFTLNATGKTTRATTDQLCNVDGAYLRFKNRMMEGTDVTRTDVGTANGSYQVETNLKRYFVDPRSNASRLTMLYTAALSSLTAGFQFRDATALLYGGAGGTVTLTGVQVTTQARQYLGLTPPSPSPYVSEQQRSFTVNQSQNGFICDRVPEGNILRRRYIKGMVGPTNYADPSDSIFGATGKPEGPHITLGINNVTTKLDQVYQQMRADDKNLFGVESMPSGYALYEPARNKKLANSIQLANVANAQNTVDVSYTPGSINTIQITDEQLIGVSAAQFSAQR